MGSEMCIRDRQENEPLPPQPREGLRPGRLEPPPGLGHPRLRWPRRGLRQERRQAYRRPQAGPAAEPSQHDRSISQRVISSGRLLDKHARRHSRRLHCAPRSAAIGCGATTKKAVEGTTLALDEAACAHRRRTPAPHVQGLTPLCARCRHRRPPEVSDKLPSVWSWFVNEPAGYIPARERRSSTGEKGPWCLYQEITRDPPKITTGPRWVPW